MKILFSWNNGDLILRARKPGDSQILQLIPRSKLSGDFPRHFIDEYTHWLDLKSRELEFRPAGSPWTPGSSNWRLYIYEPGVYPRALLRKPSQDNSWMQLVDIRSNTFRVVSSILSPLESPENIIASYTTQLLEISLPRLHMSFFVNSDWEFECRSIPGYVIDKIQSCGTMFGLRNKLILCPATNSYEESLLPRRIIIPQGKVSFSLMGDFTSVSINTDGEQHVRWHEYTIDTQLGCLMSYTSLSSKLYQCYLHALTSHCLPDPLLGHTGTEEALYMLRSASCQSFQRLDGIETKLLEMISDLTPNRVYYPQHLRSMASVKWNDLPALSQHHDFFGAVCTILDHARLLEAFYDQPIAFESHDRDPSLLIRAASRNKSYYPSDLQISELPSSVNDVEYRSRDVLDSESSEHVAYRTSWSIWNGQSSLGYGLPTRKLWDLMCSWGSLGPASSKVSLEYSRYWLKCGVARDWFVIFDLCRRAVNGNLRNSRIKLSFCLSAAAYSNSKFAEIVPILIIFALDPRCGNLKLPPERSYTLSDGVAPEHTRLEILVSKFALPMYSIPTQFFEERGTSKKAKKRRKKEYDRIIGEQSSAVADSILRWWPDYSSVYFGGPWVDVYQCRRYTEEYIDSVSRNVRLRDHVLQLERILQRYVNVLIPGAAATSYLFSPRFTTHYTKSISYSIRDVFSIRTTVPNPPIEGEPFPFPGINIPPSAETEGCLAPVGSDRLRDLIDELRFSRQPLLQIYGDELNESHREFVKYEVSQSARGAVPSYERLRLYHDKCSRKKDRLFSEISAVLAPSQYMEKANDIAGLWPRVTPRTLLRQLAQNHIVTLPDRWKGVIKRYAVFLIKYQQSQRLLELSLRQRHEELLREIESIRSNVLAESTPDWLLIQVRQLRSRRSKQVDQMTATTDRSKSRSSPSSGRCRTRNDLSKLKTEHISSTQYGRGQIISHRTSRRFYSRGWLKPYESRDSQASFKPDVPAPC